MGSSVGEGWFCFASCLLGGFFSSPFASHLLSRLSAAIPERCLSSPGTAGCRRGALQGAGRVCRALWFVGTSLHSQDFAALPGAWGTLGDGAVPGAQASPCPGSHFPSQPEGSAWMGIRTSSSSFSSRALGFCYFGSLGMKLIPGSLRRKSCGSLWRAGRQLGSAQRGDRRVVAQGTVWGQSGDSLGTAVRGVIRSDGPSRPQQSRLCWCFLTELGG